jgi:hypothetical protein
MLFYIVLVSMPICQGLKNSTEHHTRIILPLVPDEHEYTLESHSEHPEDILMLASAIAIHCSDGGGEHYV